jgi:hypothetical protein
MRLRDRRQIDALWQRSRSFLRTASAELGFATGSHKTVRSMAAQSMFFSASRQLNGLRRVRLTRTYRFTSAPSVQAY